ncbi:MAG TPA: GDYXXLXY domain-containing protein [Chitinophagaceae bacterium]
MNSKMIFVLAFIPIALVQLYVPARIIIDRFIVLNTGREFRFRTAPIDPNDPFRGKYIDLLFNDNAVQIQTKESWTNGEKVFVLLTTDSNGFARISSPSRERPRGSEDYLIAKAGYVNCNDSKLSIEFPFDRFYMEESKAHEAELTYNRVSEDSSQFAYALVNIKNGESVLKDVMINGISIREIVKQQQNKK